MLWIIRALQEGVPVGFKPLLVVDVWAHAFMRDYQATERGKHIAAFFRDRLAS